MQINITRATIGDVAVLKDLCTTTFIDTYAEHNTEADMQEYLSRHFTTERLSAQLQEEDCFFYFAEYNGEKIGYIKLNTGVKQTEHAEMKALEIERIYVLKAYQGVKAGHALIEKAMAAGADIRAPYVWLGVWEKNSKAITFYERHGFVAFDTHIFVLGEDQQKDILMKKSV
ncbi:GNAT family N-acetyltransferase [Chitinophaga solisilvae]|uniref:GNAT family N-acetyltransferase n=1 Tax=Chitinophaga solisilvae TaxID=1233460 RepID=UPI0013719D68|nr:GNAT family N-acetyltransferase [Chitinophaga solisilvae]